MARVEESDVREIITTSLASITAHITLATQTVDRCVAASSESPATADLKEFERWLAAHFVAVSDRQPVQEVFDSGATRVSYRPDAHGEHFESTSFGRTALAIDPTGELARLGAKSVGFMASE